jgi:hypothetical protein
MRIGKVGNTTLHFSIIGSIALTLLVCLLTGGLKSCNSDDTDTDTFIEQESDRLASQFINHMSRRSDY